jgi:hypothetical protein
MNALSVSLQKIEIGYFGALKIREAILADDFADLPDLIGLRFRAEGLEVDDLIEVRLGENVMAAADSQVKSQPEQEGDQMVERDVRVGLTAEDFEERFARIAHVEQLSVSNWIERWRDDRGYTAV